MAVCEQELVHYKSNNYTRIYRIVRQIPRGRVATYGQVAELAGLEGHARQVGYALHALPDGLEIPWHRVVNARGEISPRSAGDSHELQKELLAAEGIAFDTRARIDLKKFQWSNRTKLRPSAPAQRGARK